MILTFLLNFFKQSQIIVSSIINPHIPVTNFKRYPHMDKLASSMPFPTRNGFHIISFINAYIRMSKR